MEKRELLSLVPVQMGLGVVGVLDIDNGVINVPSMLWQDAYNGMEISMWLPKFYTVAIT